VPFPARPPCPFCITTTVGDLGHHAEVVGDEQHTRAMPSLDVLDQVEDLRLRGHVQRRGRLVGDQQRRFQASAMAIMMRWRWPPDSWWG
jgi:hypothetical protein